MAVQVKNPSSRSRCDSYVFCELQKIDFPSSKKIEIIMGIFESSEVMCLYVKTLYKF